MHLEYRPFSFLSALLILLAVPRPALAQWQVTERKASRTEAGQLTSVTLSDGNQEVAFHLFIVPAHRFRFRVVPNIDRQIPSVRSAVRNVAGLAGINGGYFHEDGTPLGLLIAGGKVLHPLEHAKLLSGVLIARNGRSAIVRAASIHNTQGIQEAIQAGPFLVGNSEPVPGLNDIRVAPRSFVFRCDGERWGIGVGRSATLAQTARILANPALLPDTRINAALNFDGGSSTGFWAEIEDQKVDISEWSVVSDYLVIEPAQKDSEHSKRSFLARRFAISSPRPTPP